MATSYPPDMRLFQGQIWQAAGEFIRVVKVERLSVSYKIAADAVVTARQHQTVTKKDFCRLLKTKKAVLASGLEPAE